MVSIRSSILDDKHSKAILLLALLLFSWLAGIKNLLLDWTSPAVDSATPMAPNILMIVVDDLGYNDTDAINKGGLPTPHIRQLAASGVTFRRHYADSTCTPSRVGILSGRYPERSGFRPVGAEIPAEFTTVAQALKRAGYATYLTGKWHAGEERKQAWPLNKGFDGWFGFLNQWELSGPVTEASKGQRKPTYRNPMLRENDGDLHRHEGHLTDILTDHTIQKIQQLQSGTAPWFMYHAFLAPHHPIQPAERYARNFPDTPEGRYTALVTQLDDAIGRILQAIDKENTLVVFVSDNGGTNRERNNNFPFYGSKNQMFEGAFRTPLIISWNDHIPQGTSIDDVVMNVDIYPTLLAAAHVQAPTDLDGKNLMPLLRHANALSARSRGWEVYSANINAVNFSFLASSGDWRLASPYGYYPGLHSLLQDPSGELEVGDQHPALTAELNAAFWQDHWRKSLIAVSAEPGPDPSQTLYKGFDAMRTPNQYGFSIGLEVGPLDTARMTPADNAGEQLAGQHGVWELRYKPGLGLEWKIGDITLTDPHFEPSRCNAIVLTGYFEPKGHLAVRDPLSHLKLYSSGFLRDAQSMTETNPVSDELLSTPTVVNFDGKALFSNMMLSSYADNYSPRLDQEFVEIYANLYRAQKLSLADVQMMNSQLCKRNGD